MLKSFNCGTEPHCGIDCCSIDVHVLEEACRKVNVRTEGLVCLVSVVSRADRAGSLRSLKLAILGHLGKDRLTDLLSRASGPPEMI